MNLLAAIAERQTQAHQALKETLQSSGHGYRDLAGVVNPNNIEWRSKGSFLALNECLERLTQPLKVAKARTHDMGYGLG